MKSEKNTEGCFINEPVHEKKLLFCKNKGLGELHCNSTAVQCLYFCYIDSTIALIPKLKISNL